MAITNTRLGSTETTIIKAGQPANKSVLCIVFCNTDSTEHTLTLYCYPSGGSASDSTTIAASVSIPAKDSWIWSGGDSLVLSDGDKISGLADAANVITATTSYLSL